MSNESHGQTEELAEAIRYVIQQGGYAVGKIPASPLLPKGGLAFTNGTNHFAIAFFVPQGTWMWGTLDGATWEIVEREEDISIGDLAKRLRRYVDEQARAQSILERAFGQEGIGKP